MESLFSDFRDSAQTEYMANGRRQAISGNEEYTQVTERYNLTEAHYNRFKNFTPEEKEDHYERMGLPRMKRKRLHFKTIDFFTVCVHKYFSPVVTQILNQDNENYGGLRQTLNVFQEKI